MASIRDSDQSVGNIILTQKLMDINIYELFTILKTSVILPVLNIKLVTTRAFSLLLYGIISPLTFYLLAPLCILFKRFMSIFKEVSKLKHDILILVYFDICTRIIF